MTTTTLSMHTGARLTSSAAGASGSPEADATWDGSDLTRELVLAEFDPAFSGTTMDLRRGVHLADRIYSLDDPWRSRFVDLVQRRVDGDRSGGYEASRTQLAIWLADRSLARMIRLMLRAWMHEN